MNIIMVSASRADFLGLQAVAGFLRGEGHQVELQQHDGDEAFNSVTDENYHNRADLAFIHGDRWDALLAATALVRLGIPIAHIGGGAITAGSYDNKFRYAISELADLHFVATEDDADRLDRWAYGNPPIHVVGEPAIDWLKRVDLPSREKLLDDMPSLAECDGFVLVNWQPETMAPDPNRGLDLILQALAGWTNARTAYVFCSVNEDRGADEARRLIIDFARTLTGRRVIQGLPFPPEKYAALLKHCDVMVGNSSSGLIEAPAFGTRFVLVGDRQRGRPIGANVFCHGDNAKIALIGSDIEVSRTLRGRPVDNPYGDGHAGERIANVLRSWRDEVRRPEEVRQPADGAAGSQPAAQGRAPEEPPAQAGQ